MDPAYLLGIYVATIEGVFETFELLCNSMPLGAVSCGDTCAL